MGIDINLTISNVNNEKFTTILLRKFFNMVFIDPKGKILHIYTATIFTGAEQGTSNSQCPLPKASDTKCRLDFSYDVLEAEEISFDNITDSLVTQYDQLDKVWYHCEKLTSQNDISKKLNDLYSKNYKVPSMDQGKHFLFIQAPTTNDNSYCCVANEGEYECLSEENKYSLYCGEYSGVEAINWIKTTIVMPDSVLNKNICFKITFVGSEKFYTPDFTWYFAPPTNYIVDGNCTEVKVGGTSEKNGIASVAERTTVDFKEWVDTEKINERNKSRIICLKELIKGDLTYLTNNTIQVDLTFINPLKHVNRQFFMGLIVAFALSYCSDKTRLNDYLSCIKKYCTCTESMCDCANLNNLQGVVFPGLILLSFISSIFRGKTCLPITNWKKIVLILFKSTGIIATILLMIFVFVLWLIIPDLVNRVVTSCETNKILIISLMSTGFIGNIIYILYCIFRRKRNVMDFF